jgi:CheY-like chemotaxis protein
MPVSRKFLIVDDNADSRFLLVKTLLRKFPQAVVQECQDGDAAVALVRSEKLDAIVAHRAAEVDGLTLIRMLRQANPTLPIVMVSGFDRSKESLAAGATCFLSYDAWLRIGTVVAELLAPTTSAGDSDGLKPPTTVLPA